MRKNPTYTALLEPTRLSISEKSATYTIKWSYTIIWQVRVSRLGQISKQAQDNPISELFWQKNSLITHNYAYFDTLTCQIIVQDHLIVSVADFTEINKPVGLNKAMKEGFFLIYEGEN